MSKLIQTIARDYRTYDDAALGNYALKVSLSLADSPVYKAVQPDTAKGSEVIHEYFDTVAKAKNGGAVAVACKREKRQEVLDLLDAWSAFATITTPNDVLAWMQAGFNVTKDASVPAQPLPAPSKFTTFEGSSKGSVGAHQNAQRGVKAYVTEYAKVPTDGGPVVWFYVLSSKSDCEISGLESKVEYMFRGGAWNGTSDPIFSPIETRVVQ